MKRIEVYHQGRCHHLDHREPLRLSARLDFADNPTNLYGVAPADSAPLSYGDTVASVRHGGVCNAERISLVPHCHGTHTECIGHILPETRNVADLPLEPFIAATLIRIRPQRADATAESYNASAACEDWLITRAALRLLHSAGLWHLTGADRFTRGRDESVPGVLHFVRRDHLGGVWPQEKSLSVKRLSLSLPTGEGYFVHTETSLFSSSVKFSAFR